MDTTSIPDLVLRLLLGLLTLLITIYVQNRDRRERIQLTMNELHDAARTIVRSFEQTRVRQAKAEAGTDRLGDTQALEIAQAAASAVIDTVASGKLDALAARLGIDTVKTKALVDSLVEAEVFELKRPAA